MKTHYFDDIDLVNMKDIHLRLTELRESVDDLACGFDVNGFKHYASICNSLDGFFYPTVYKENCERVLLIDIFVMSWLLLYHPDKNKSTRCMVYPVNGRAEWYTEFRAETFWKNPKRTEYLEYLIDSLSVCIERKRITLDEH